MAKWYARDPRWDARWNVIFDSDGLSIADLVKRADQSIWAGGVMLHAGWSLDSLIVIDDNEFCMHQDLILGRGAGFYTQFKRLSDD